MEVKKIIPVAACILKQAGRYLITQRKKHSHLGHLWEFPGGKIEKGESVYECAIRECEEELGILVKPLKIIEEITHHYANHYAEASVHLFFVSCKLMEGSPRALDCADFAWVRPEELKNYSFPEADKKLIDRLSLED